MYGKWVSNYSILHTQYEFQNNWIGTDRDPGPGTGKSRPFFSDFYPGPGNFQEQTGINRNHFYKSVICSRL